MTRFSTATSAVGLSVRTTTLATLAMQLVLARHAAADCRTDDDCKGGRRCVKEACVAAVPCAVDKDCPGDDVCRAGICDQEPKRTPSGRAAAGPEPSTADPVGVPLHPKPAPAVAGVSEQAGESGAARRRFSLGAFASPIVVASVDGAKYSSFAAFGLRAGAVGGFNLNRWTLRVAAVETFVVGKNGTLSTSTLEPGVAFHWGQRWSSAVGASVGYAITSRTSSPIGGFVVEPLRVRFGAGMQWEVALPLQVLAYSEAVHHCKHTYLNYSPPAVFYNYHYNDESDDDSDWASTECIAARQQQVQFFAGVEVRFSIF